MSPRQSIEFSNTSKSSRVLEDKLFRSSTGERIILLFAEDVLESSLAKDIVDSQDTLLDGGVGRDGTTVRGLFCRETCREGR